VRPKKRRTSHSESLSVPANSDKSSHVRASSDGSALLHLLADALTQAAGIYNQGAVSKVTVEGPSRSGPPRLRLTIQSMGYCFEETAEGALYVSEIGDGTPRGWASLEPQTDQAGRIVCWRERKLRTSTSPTLRTVDGLSEEYLLNLLRRRLVPTNQS
jgi:hypothetical protein